MPSAPLRHCVTPGCPNRVKDGHCRQHQQKRQRVSDQARGTRHQRGYDNEWDRLSKRNLAAQPWCVGYPKGQHKPYTVLAEVTDHIIPIKRRPDLRLEPSNLQSLCSDCNRRKGIAEEGGLGR